MPSYIHPNEARMAPSTVLLANLLPNTLSSPLLIHTSLHISEAEAHKVSPTRCVSMLCTLYMSLYLSSLNDDDLGIYNARTTRRSKSAVCQLGQQHVLLEIVRSKSGMRDVPFFPRVSCCESIRRKTRKNGTKTSLSDRPGLHHACVRDYCFSWNWFVGDTAPNILTKPFDDPGQRPQIHPIRPPHILLPTQNLNSRHYYAQFLSVIQ